MKKYIGDIVECNCGCGIMIAKYDKLGRERFYVNHHGPAGAKVKERKLYICTVCKKQFKDFPYKVRKFCSKICFNKYKLAKEPIPRLSNQGYVSTYKAGIRTWQHRAITNVSDEFVVHHIDKNRSNNNPNNLQILTNSQHMKLHRQN
jgi:hypothetical protein